MKPFVEEISRKMEGNEQMRTARAYLTALRSLELFLGRPPRFSDIVAEQIKRYERWLKDKKLAQNTVSFYMRNMRAINNRAVSAGLTAPPEGNPFAEVYTGIAQTAKRSLNEGEMRKLALKTEIVHKTRAEKLKARARTVENKYIAGKSDALRMFMFCFHAQGMSFADAYFLKKSNIYGNKIVYRRRKTGKDVVVFINSEAAAIMDFYRGSSPDSPYFFPFVNPSCDHRSEYLQYCAALSSMNRKLKSASKRAGIERHISFHVARHSWASFAQNNGESLTVVSSALGHQSEKTTQIYLNHLDSGEVAKAGNRIAGMFALDRGVRYKRKSVSVAV
jgi:integrase